MQMWMIAPIIVACVVVLLTATYITWALMSVHIILGRRKSPTVKNDDGSAALKYGVHTLWFDLVKDTTEEISITSYDGVSLGATLIRQGASNGRVAICCHGYGATRRSMQPQAKLFYDRGFDVILPSMRGHNGSGGKVGMAWLDRFDLLRWIDKAIKIFGKDVNIAICGTSMGGATVIAASGMNPPSQVKCVIDDCGFSSQIEEYKACLGNVSSVSQSIAMSAFKLGVRLVHGYSISDADITKLASNMSIPALFFHGDADDFVPYALGKRLFESCSSEDKRFVTVEGARHALAYVADTEKYVDEFTRFVDKYIVGSALVCDTTEALEELETRVEAEKQEQARLKAERQTEQEKAETTPSDVEQSALDGESESKTDAIGKDNIGEAEQNSDGQAETPTSETGSEQTERIPQTQTESVADAKPESEN